MKEKYDLRDKTYEEGEMWVKAVGDSWNVKSREIWEKRFWAEK
jgi:hypothetical protein